MQILTVILLIPIAFVILIYLLRYPEVAFGLFLFSHIIKGGMNFPWYLNLTLIMLAVAILGFTIQFAKTRRINFRLKPADLWLLGFLAILFIGVSFTPNTGIGLIKAIRFFGIVFFPYMLARCFLTEEIKVKRFLRAIFLLALIVCITFIIISVKEGVVGRSTFFDSNGIPLATLFAVGLILAVIKAMMPFQEVWDFKRVLCAITIPVFIFGIFLTGIRGPLLAAIIGLFFYFTFGYLKRITPRFKFDSVIVLTLIAIGFCLGSFLPTFKSYSPTVIIEGTSTVERLDQYKLVKEIFPQSPLIGIGTGGFKEFTGWSYPHNIFMEVAVENGLIGLIFFGIFIGIVGWYGFRFLIFFYQSLDIKKQKMGLMILTVCLTLLIGRQFSFGLDMNKDLFVFLALIVNLPIILDFHDTRIDTDSRLNT